MVDVDAKFTVTDVGFPFSGWKIIVLVEDEPLICPRFTCSVYVPGRTLNTTGPQTPLAVRSAAEGRVAGCSASDREGSGQGWFERHAQCVVERTAVGSAVRQRCPDFQRVRHTRNKASAAKSDCCAGERGQPSRPGDVGLRCAVVHPFDGHAGQRVFAVVHQLHVDVLRTGTEVHRVDERLYAGIDVERGGEIDTEIGKRSAVRTCNGTAAARTAIDAVDVRRRRAGTGKH